MKIKRVLITAICGVQPFVVGYLGGVDLTHPNEGLAFVYLTSLFVVVLAWTCPSYSK